MTAWVGVIVFGGETWNGDQLSPLVYTTGPKDDQDSALAAGNRKARQIMRMSALVASNGDTDDLLRASEQVAQYGAAHWTYDDCPRDVVVKVSAATDEVVFP
jgi:hypothetical protein